MLKKKIHKNKCRSTPTLSLDFNELALFDSRLYPFLRFNSRGKTTIDWKNPNSQLSLTRAILKVKYDIIWDQPVKNLCPTIPSRINYLNWINNMLQKIIPPSVSSSSNFIGIDVGTGASLIYPLLGYKIFQWNFIATELDHESLNNAQKIIHDNNLEERIILRKSEGNIFQGIIDINEEFHFTMCNPPFFEDLEEEHRIVGWRKSNLTKSEGQVAFSMGEKKIIKMESLIKEEEEDEFKDLKINKKPRLIKKKEDKSNFLEEQISKKCDQKVKFLRKTAENKELKDNIAFNKSVISNDEIEPKNGEVGFILKMFEESKIIKSLFFSSLVGKKKDFQKLRNILEDKMKGIGEVLTGDISQGMNKRWIIGWRFKK